MRQETLTEDQIQEKAEQALRVYDQHVHSSYWLEWLDRNLSKENKNWNKVYSRVQKLIADRAGQTYTEENWG